LCFETKGGEEELSFSCRVGASTSRTATEAAKKQGAKRPANKRRRERARRRESLGGKKKMACKWFCRRRSTSRLCSNWRS
jgi:hypothetical protein